MSDDRKIIRFPGANRLGANPGDSAGFAGSASPRRHGDPVGAPPGATSAPAPRMVAAQAGRALVGGRPQAGGPEGAGRLAVGPLAFSCTGCGAACQADFRRMIFRSVEFHCADCGTFFRVSNPGFAGEPPKPRR